jgi:hypothetical protein
MAETPSAESLRRARESVLARARRGDSYSVLLALIVVTYVVMALLDKGLWSRFIVSALLGAVLMLALYTSHFRGRAFRISAALVAFVLLTTFLQALFGRHGNDGTMFIMFVLLIAAPFVVVARILRHRVVGRETLLGAICVYVLLGLAFAGIYAGVNDIQTGQFFAQKVIASNIDFLYFSFVVLTTLGFGDLTARSDVGRVLVTLEAMAGQVFLVTLVARLVALYGVDRSSELEQ